MITGSSLPLVAAPAFAFLVTLALVRWLIKGNIPVLDHPNARSLHATAIPRTGGLGLLAGDIGVMGASASLSAVDHMAPRYRIGIGIVRRRYF